MNAEERFPEDAFEPAFPTPIGLWADGDVEQSPNLGITMRDWFAAQALVGLLAQYYGQAVGQETVAKNAYTLADAMLVERSKR